MTNLEQNKNNEKITDTVDNENINLIQTLKNELNVYKETTKKLILKQNTDLVNINNRLNIEMQKCEKFSLEKLISEFLLIIDNIERAFNLIKQQNDKKYVEILNNIDYIFSLIDNIFSEFQISKINQTKVAFNPDIHQAISIQYTDAIESNQIIEIMQPGYTLCKSRLLRPAMVIVSKNKNNN